MTSDLSLSASLNQLFQVSGVGFAQYCAKALVADGECGGIRDGMARTTKPISSTQSNAIIAIFFFRIPYLGCPLIYHNNKCVRLLARTIR